MKHRQTVTHQNKWNKQIASTINIDQPWILKS